MIDIERERELMRERALGSGLEFDLINPGVDLARDIRLVSGLNGTDFSMTGSFANLAQSLSVALSTRLGDDVFNTVYGFDGLNALAEEVNPVMQRERIRISIIVVLRKDPRVRRIVDVAFVDSRLEQPTGSRKLDVRVAFEAVSGDQLAIDLGKVVVND